MKIAVIGIGGVGSAACRFAALAGHEVVGYEQFSICHARGSSHGESRIIRLSYPDVLYTQMMADAYPLWAQLEADAGEELFIRCGGLLFGSPHSEDVIATMNSLDAAGLTYEVLQADEARERFPAFGMNDNEIALYQESSGFLRSSLCVSANVRLARKLGADIREQTAVIDIISDARGVTVCAHDGEENFDAAIVTAGAWMNKVLAGVNLPLTVVQRQYQYVSTPAHPEFYAPGKMPIWIDAQNMYYGFPADGQVEGVKLASHMLGAPLGPDSSDRPVIEENVEDALAVAAERLPGTGGEIVNSKACLYTMTPDENFVIDRAPGYDNVWLCSACSGHGFKFTVLLGQLMVGLATGGSYRRDLSRFSATRFS